jgi:hypothetical protein
MRAINSPGSPGEQGGHIQKGRFILKYWVSRDIAAIGVLW